MATVQPLRPIRFETRSDPGRGNVIRLVEVLGPLSPELVLVDPELAARARALLPEAPGIRVVRQLERTEPTLTPAHTPPTPRPIQPRLRVAALVVGAAVAASGVSWWGAAALRDGEPALESAPPVAAPTLRSPDPVPTPPSATKPTSPAQAVAPPRFVWPAEAGAAGYRVALFRDGRQIFERDVAKTALQLPRSWSYASRLYDLTRGTYRWVVWPLFGGAKRPGPAIVSAQYAV